MKVHLKTLARRCPLGLGYSIHGLRLWVHGPDSRAQASERMLLMDLGFGMCTIFTKLFSAERWVCLVRQVVVRDVYKERDIGRFTGSFTDIIEAHGVLALRLTPVRWVLCT